jgi:hypothetical protein
MYLTDDIKNSMRISYALRRVPQSNFATLLPLPASPQRGDLALAKLEKIGKNAAVELANGRRCALHEGDLLAVVFGNRYATLQFEGYARRVGKSCDLLSMGGLCGLVESRHSKAAEPSRLSLLGALGNHDGVPLSLGYFALRPADYEVPPRIVAVCGTSMDAGKTHTVMSLIIGLRQQGERVAGVKLTGTATGKDTWNMLDAGACLALDFIDGGLPSTYGCSLDELLRLHHLLISRAAAAEASWMVVEIADGLLQGETAALLRSPRFTATVDAWVLAAGDPVGAVGGYQILRDWGIRPSAISGLTTMSALAIREVHAGTKLPCLTAGELQAGALNVRLTGSSELMIPPRQPDATAALDRNP